MITVLIPTYKRTKDLHRCLEALLKQSRLPEEILVVVRDTDAETRAFLEEHYAKTSRIRSVTVTVPGQVAALNAGLEAAAGDIIAITDDDTVPRQGWVSRLERHFKSDPRVGGVGGRDWVHHNGITESGTKRSVGKIQWFGRIIGNHHLGAGDPRTVDLLKGANMSYRRSAIAGLRFEERLKGTGAQVYNDLDFSMAVKRAGWKLVYDPAVAVDHYPAPRFDEDQRNSFNSAAFANEVHNETFTLLKHSSLVRRICYLLWVWSVGTTSSPGLVQWLRLLPKGAGFATRKWLAAMKGRREGIRSWRSLDKGVSS